MSRDALCDCDAEYKEVRTIQRSKGGSVGPLGGHHGNGKPVIICKNCGGMFEPVNEDTEDASNLFDLF